MLSYQYRKSHYGDKMAVRSSYLYNGNSYAGKRTSLHWFSPLVRHKCIEEHGHHCFKFVIGIDTNIEVIVVSFTTWEAHHSPRAKPEVCGELLRSLMRQQWPNLRYQFLFYHNETKLMMNKQILSIWMLKFVPKLSLVTAWLHVHILGSCDLIVSPW